MLAKLGTLAADKLLSTFCPRIKTYAASIIKYNSKCAGNVSLKD